MNDNKAKGILMNTGGKNRTANKNFKLKRKFKTAFQIKNLGSKV